MAVEELLTRLVNLENEAVQARQRQASAEQALAAAQQRIAQLSSGTDVSTTPPGVIDTRTLGKPKSFSGQTSEWTTWQFTFKAFACAVHPKMKEVFDLATQKGVDPVNASDITGELQSLSTQLYYMLVMMLSDQAQEIVRNSPESIGAEVWRKLLWEYEPGVGIRYGAMLQSLLKRRFGEHDETDLAREIESFERDISKYEQQSNDLISDAIKHGIVCGGMAHQGLEQHIDLSISRLSTYKAPRDEIINYSRARRTWTDPNAMQVDAVHVNVNQERQGGSSGSRSEKGTGGRSKSKKGGKGKEREEKAASKFNGECRYCQKKGHEKADCRKMKADIDAGRCDKSGKPKGVNALTVTGATQPSPEASYAPSMASTIPLQQMVPVYFPCPASACRTLVHQHDRAGPEDSYGCKLGRSRIRVTGFWIRLDILSNQLCRRSSNTAKTYQPANFEQRHWIGQRQVGYRLENGEPFVVTWHVANVMNLIISTESLMAANIEVRHARNESSMIMDRCGTRSSVVLHKFAKEPWLKLYRDNSVLDSDLRIAAINTNANGHR